MWIEIILAYALLTVVGIGWIVWEAHNAPMDYELWPERNRILVVGENGSWSWVSLDSLDS